MSVAGRRDGTKKLPNHGAALRPVLDVFKLRRGWLLFLSCAPGHLRFVDNAIEARRPSVACVQCLGMSHPRRDRDLEECRVRMYARRRAVGFETATLEVLEGRRP